MFLQLLLDEAGILLLQLTILEMGLQSEKEVMDREEVQKGEWKKGEEERQEDEKQEEQKEEKEEAEEEQEEAEVEKGGRGVAPVTGSPDLNSTLVSFLCPYRCRYGMEKCNCRLTWPAVMDSTFTG